MAKKYKAFSATLAFIIATVVVISSAIPSFGETTVALTDKEKEYIKNNPEITIAMDSSWVPYALFDNASDKEVGIIPNILNIVAQRVGMSVNYVSKDTYMDAIKTVQSGETMLVSGIANDTKMADKNDVLITEPYITINYSAITKNKSINPYEDGAFSKIAVCVGSYSTMAMKKNMPKCDFVEYHSNEECMDAVSNGDVDEALIATYAAEYYMSMHEYSDLKSVLINEFSWGLCFGVNKNVDPVLIEILNKGITSLSDNDVNQAIYSSLVDTAKNNTGIKEWIYERPIVAIIVSAIIVLLISLLIYVVLMHQSKSKKLEDERILNAELLKANNAKQDFLSRMSHEIRTPLNAIIGSTALALDVDDRSEEMNEYIQQIDSSGKYLLGIINDILDAGRMESGRFKLDLEWIQPGKVLKPAIAMIAPEFLRKEINFKFNENCTISDDVEYEVDVVRCRQVLTNLLSNAMKFTPNGGTVSFFDEHLENDDKIAVERFVVSDTGCGMSEEFQKKMFEPFTQEHNILSASIQGTGLGLSVVKQIVVAMHGTIEVKSKVGEGTTFIVTIPFNWRKCEKTEESRVSNNDILSGKKVLLVEDNATNAMIASKLLQKKNMIITCSGDGLQALHTFESLSENSFDAILMDIRMPNLNGIEATKAIRALDREDAKNIPIIAMTANAYDKDKEESRQAGMNAHLSKPIDPQTLYDTLSQFLSE